MKNQTLWYRQVQQWTAAPPACLDAISRIYFQKEAQIFLESIENKYQIPSRYDFLATAMMVDFVETLEKIKKNTNYSISEDLLTAGRKIIKNEKKGIKV